MHDIVIDVHLFMGFVEINDDLEYDLSFPERLPVLVSVSDEEVASLLAPVVKLIQSVMYCNEATRFSSETIAAWISFFSF